MKKTLFILAIALCGAGVLSAQHMKGFVSAGVAGGIDASFGMPVAGPNADNTLTLEVPYSQLEKVVIDTTVLGGTRNYDDGYFTFDIITMDSAGTYQKYIKLRDARNLDVLATLNLTVRPCGPGVTVQDTVDNTIIYETVPVAGYCWTKQNLRTPSDSAASYHDEAGFGEIYGLLYPWYDAVKVNPDGSEEPTASSTGYVRGICPPSWHLPTMEEFEALSTVKTQDLRATTLWIDPRASENTNNSEFTALPAGKYNSSLSRYEDLGTATYWWSTTFYKSGSTITSAKVYVCAWYCESVLESIIPIKDKVSVRCVKEY
ncbi:MAG: hypothetical protein II859_13990 [Bacteroidales bacterium]|nr:hypothetical protein [Bacteroidales bacterium]